MDLLRTKNRVVFVATLLVWGVVTPATLAGDWPMWRHDAERSAATADDLPEVLYLSWWRDYPVPEPAWPEDPRLIFDAVYEPIVIGDTMIVSLGLAESVVALDTETGLEKWRFFAEGPVRFAPVADQGRLYFGADDGYFYCLDAADGRLIWKLRAAPSPRKVLGNDRLTSVWPIRGGPVLAGREVHFTAGVWPFEGNFLYSVDIDNSEYSPRYTSTTLTGVVPQGYLAQSDTTVLIPGGRAPVTAHDLKQDKTTQLKYRSRGLTDYHVTAKGRWLFHGHRIFDLRDKKLSDLPVPRPVGSPVGEIIYYGHEQMVKAVDLSKPVVVESTDRRGKPVQKKYFSTVWELSGEKVLEALNALEDRRSPTFRDSLEGDIVIDVRAGTRLYGHWDDVVFAVQLHGAEQAAEVAWAKTVAGTPATLLAADGKLFVGTREGRIYCFSGEQKHPKIHPLATTGRQQLDLETAERVEGYLSQAGVRDGYALVWGIPDGSSDRSYRTLTALLRQSGLRLIVVDPDVGKVTRLRARLAAEGLYGERLVVRLGEPAHYDWPPYLADLILLENPGTAAFRDGVALVKQLFGALRPYGGAACLSPSGNDHEEMKRWVAAADLSRASFQRQGKLSILRRVGALAGTANWEHEYGDPANTLFSRDTLVKAPLGVLWFGGPSSAGEIFYDRHRWPPSMAVIEGRMFVQGPGKLTAIDVYTGRILWTRPLPAGLSPGRRGWDSITGFHYVAVEDGIYLTYERSCVRLDPASGEELAEFRLPDPGDYWGSIRIAGDLIIVPAFRTVSENESKGYVTGFRSDRPGRPGRLAKRIVALNRHDGKLVWEKAAHHSIFMVSVGNDNVFCLDTDLKNFYRSGDRRGLDPTGEAPRLLRAFDLRTGEQRWQQETPMPLTWLSYSHEHDVLVGVNKSGVEARRGQDGGSLWTQTSVGHGFLGHPESVWNKVIVRKDQVIDQRGPGRFYDLLTGRVLHKTNPVTGKPVPWEFTKIGHHCNYAIANEHLVTFRAGSAGFFDLESAGTGHLEGFRAGCRNSLIPACGVLNAPNFAHGCTCDYSLFTSLSLVHVPENEKWTYNTFVTTGERVQRVGVNFGAPGDRLAPNGTLWLDHPDVGGPSPQLTVSVSPLESRPYRRHTSQIEGDGLKWVAASGLDGVTSVQVSLIPEGEGPREQRLHSVRLYFSEPAHRQIGQRVFDVSLQGKPVIEKLDIVKETGGPDRLLVKEFRNIPLTEALNIALTPRAGQPVLSGVEISAERK